MFAVALFIILEVLKLILNVYARVVDPSTASKGLVLDWHRISINKGSNYMAESIAHNTFFQDNNSITFPVAFQNTSIKDKSKEFVNIIKEDLRRNNDDYLDKLLKNTSKLYSDTNTTLTTNVIKKFRNIKVQTKKHGSFQSSANTSNKVKTNRRAFDIPMDSEGTKLKVFAKQSSNLFPKRFNQITKPIPRPFNNTMLTKEHNKVNVDKLEKVKSFLDDNKDLLKEFISKKKMEMLTQATKTTRDTFLRMRAQDNIEDRTLPNDEQLDMAPAKGGRIHAMRLKGRLCQRNVLMPEGPKYDSKGNVYLGAFSPKPGQNYAQTVPPILILPRCCNCCKKSVLGCE